MAKAKTVAKKPAATRAKKPAAKKPVAKKPAAKKPAAKKSVVKPPLPKGPALKRLALAAAPDSVDGPRVSPSALDYVRDLFVAAYQSMAEAPLTMLLEKNAKSKNPKSAFNYKHIGASKEDKERLAELSCKGKSRKEIKEQGLACLYIPRGVFKKYLMMGSDDGSLTGFYAAKFAPKKTNKNGEVIQKFRFSTEFLNGLQEQIEGEVIDEIRQVWPKKGKTLTDVAFGAEHKPKKKAAPKKEGAKKAATSKAGKAGKKKASPKKEGAKKKAVPKKTGGKAEAPKRRGRPPKK